MNRSRVISLFTLALLGASLLLSCSERTPIPAEDRPSTVQPTEPIRVEPTMTSTPVADDEEETVPIQDTADTDEILVLIADEIATLEPYRMVRVHPEGSIASHVWDTLTLLNDDLQIEPHLAESWRLVNNFTWEFTIRQGITFHNGEPLDAQAVRFSIDRARSMPGSLESFAQDADLEQAERVSDHVLRIVTRRPVPNLPYHLAFLEIVPPVYYSETDPSQLAVAPVGSGPYRVDSWTPGEPLTLEAVPTYWGGTPSWTRLVFRTTPSAQDRIVALASEGTALATDLSPAQAAQWDPANGRLAAMESTQRMFVGMHVKEGGPLADRRIRQALNYGVDVPQIVDDWLEGYGKRYGSWVNPPGNNLSLAPWPYDPEKARELLTETGYPDGFATTLRTPSGVYHQDVAIAQAIARQLGEIGVAVKVEVVDWDTYVRGLVSDDPPPLFLLGMNSRGDGLEDVKSLSIDSAYNPTGWQNELFEETLGRAVNSFYEDSRSRLLNEAQAIAYEEAPWIWLWRRYDFYGVDQDLDWTPRPDGLVYLYKTKAEPAGTGE